MHAIHNARIQLLATTFNNIGVGAVVAGVLAPLVRGDIGGLGAVVIWLLIGADFLILAQTTLGRLRP